MTNYFCNAPEVALIIWKAVKDDQVNLSGLLIVGEDKILAAIDVLAVVVPGNDRHWVAMDNTVERHLLSIFGSNIFQLLNEHRGSLIKFQDYKE